MIVAQRQPWFDSFAYAAPDMLIHGCISEIFKIENVWPTKDNAVVIWLGRLLLDKLIFDFTKSTQEISEALEHARRTHSQY
jgi:hypothetical protein